MEEAAEVARWVWSNPAETVILVELVVILLLAIATGFTGPLTAWRKSYFELEVRNLLVWIASGGVAYLASLLPGITPAWIIVTFLAVFIAAWFIEHPWTW